MHLVKVFRGFPLWAAVGAVSLSVSCSILPPTQRTNVGSAGPGVELQEKKTYAFKRSEVYFSNEFNSARLNNVSRLNNRSFLLQIKPENEPINRSPWYAFKVWSEQPKTIEITLDYGDVRHRYAPKSYNRRTATWETLKGVSQKEGRTKVTFTLAVGPDTTWVSGQPIFNKDSIVNWLEGLGQKPFVELREIGKSTLGQPIFGYHTPAVASKQAVLILGGQHPPEFTGYQAQVAFTNFVLGDNPLAKRFRESFQVVGVPWINPDGNNLGHWRHNVAGVDLNRDWTTFIQKETSAARDFVLQFADGEGASFHFGVDFHSTFEDILYTNNPDPKFQTHHSGLMDRWIARWNSKLGDKEVPVRPSDANGRVSKSWMLTELGAEAVTYEVADTTPIEEIRFKAEQAAIAIMKELLGE